MFFYFFRYFFRIQLSEVANIRNLRKTDKGKRMTDGNIRRFTVDFKKTFFRNS